MMRGAGRMTSFDPETGRLTAEAGTLLADILATFVPRGFFPPVVPGTKFVTLGGMIAADVHGKNHHRDGGFGRHVESFTLALPGGEIVACSPSENAELFKATIGGMGLTGTILEVTFRLAPIETGWMRQQTIVAQNLDAAMAALEAANEAHYCVAWIDCLAQGAHLGRSLIYRGEHASRTDVIRMGQALPHFPAPGDRSVSVPIDFPGFALNSLSVKAFNEWYFRHGAAAAGPEMLIATDPFFFPLDSIHDWNRIYGKNGFLQHQCVIPAANARVVLSDILGRIARLGNASFLAVLKIPGTRRRPHVISHARLHAGARFLVRREDARPPRRDRRNHRRFRGTHLPRQGRAPKPRNAGSRLCAGPWRVPRHPPFHRR